MPETVISVQGSHTAWYPAERATVSISVGVWPILPYNRRLPLGAA